MSDKIKASKFIEVDDKFIDEIHKKLKEREVNEKPEPYKKYSVKEIAQLTFRTIGTIQKYIRQGILIAHIPDGKRDYVIYKKDLDSFINEKYN